MGTWTIAENSTIANNVLQQNKDYGIYCYGRNSTFSGNTILGISANHNCDIYGIIFDTDADCNVFTGNVVNFHRNAGSGTEIGVYICDADQTTIVGNIFLFNDVACVDSGTNTILSGNNDS